MPKKLESAIVRREHSDLGKVFPSGVRIGETSYGLGVFAFAFIPKGTPIARVSGRIIHDAHYSSDYCIDAGEDKVLEPGLPFCYLNHACEPNCQLMHYVKEADDEEGLATGELTEEEMNIGSECELEDDEVFYDDAFYDGIVGGLEEEEGAEAAYALKEADTDDDESLQEENIFENDADAEIWVEATCDIMPNEELTIDYAWAADRAARCLCGKPQCRGWIVDPAERHLLPE